MPWETLTSGSNSVRLSSGSRSSTSAEGDFLFRGDDSLWRTKQYTIATLVCNHIGDVLYWLLSTIARTPLLASTNTTMRHGASRVGCLGSYLFGVSLPWLEGSSLTGSRFSAAARHSKLSSKWWPTHQQVVKWFVESIPKGTLSILVCFPSSRTDHVLC